MLLVFVVLVDNVVEGRGQRGHLLQLLDPARQNHHQREEEDDEQDLTPLCLRRDVAITCGCNAYHRVVNQVMEDEQLDAVVFVSCSFLKFNCNLKI